MTCLLPSRLDLSEYIVSDMTHVGWPAREWSLPHWHRHSTDIGQSHGWRL
jgi:hypothetical protein